MGSRNNKWCSDNVKYKFKSIDDISDWIIAISNQIFIYKQIATSTELSKSMYETGVAMNKNFIKIASLIKNNKNIKEIFMNDIYCIIKRNVA